MECKDKLYMMWMMAVMGIITLYIAANYLIDDIDPQHYTALIFGAMSVPILFTMYYFGKR